MATNIVKWKATFEFEAQSPSGEKDRQVFTMPIQGRGAPSCEFHEAVAEAIKAAFAVWDTDEETAEAQLSEKKLQTELARAKAKVDKLTETMGRMTTPDPPKKAPVKKTTKAKKE